MLAKYGNYAFIDGQNLHFGTTKCTSCAVALGKDIKSMKLNDCTCGQAWEVDLHKFKIYLAEKYNVTQAYYFLGYVHDENEELYSEIQKSGFIVAFKEHHRKAKSTKKGNVDTDLVFEIMRNLIEEGEQFEQVVLVSNDGDYKKLVQYLISKGRFRKILHPNKKFASALYKQFGSEIYDYLENIRTHIQKRKGLLRH